MAKVTDCCFEATGHTTVICDFSPPRSGDTAALSQAAIPANFISVAYNPGKSVRANSPMTAASIKNGMGYEVVFTLATRDMNKLALESQMLGAQILGLENVVIVQGDLFNERDLTQVKDVRDFSPTGLISAIAGMNSGIDFKGTKLRQPTDFCIGATVDLGLGTEREAHLAYRKVQSGAEFLISQPIFASTEARRFQQAYTNVSGEPLACPVFFGLQVLEPDGIIFSSVPESVRDELKGGRGGVDIAIEIYEEFQDAGIHNIYLVPPIRRGGARNYAAAREFLDQAKRL